MPRPPQDQAADDVGCRSEESRGSATVGVALATQGARSTTNTPSRCRGIVAHRRPRCEGRETKRRERRVSASGPIRTADARSPSLSSGVHDKNTPPVSSRRTLANERAFTDLLLVADAIEKTSAASLGRLAPMRQRGSSDPGATGWAPGATIDHYVAFSLAKRRTSSTGSSIKSAIASSEMPLASFFSTHSRCCNARPFSMPLRGLPQGRSRGLLAQLCFCEFLATATSCEPPHDRVRWIAAVGTLLLILK